MQYGDAAIAEKGSFVSRKEGLRFLLFVIGFACGPYIIRASLYLLSVAAGTSAGQLVPFNIGSMTLLILVYYVLLGYILSGKLFGYGRFPLIVLEVLIAGVATPLVAALYGFITLGFYYTIGPVLVGVLAAHLRRRAKEYLGRAEGVGT